MPKVPAKSRPGRRRKSAGEPATEALLLDAAARAFGHLGFERTRLEDIAREAGITRPSLLHHFGSKRALYEATLAAAFAELEREVGPALLRQGSYDERVSHLLRSLIGFDQGHRDMVATIFRGMLRDDDDLARDAIRTAFIPLLERMEAFVRFNAGDRLRADFPVRQAIMSVISNQLLHSTLGDFGAELWGGAPETESLAAGLMLFSATETPADR
jgi:AcrR family transcriptional regulator